MPPSSYFPLLCFILFASICSSASALDSPTAPATPAQRHYDSHIYYVVELDPATLSTQSSIPELIESLGGELVEQVGELKRHYLIRAERGVVERGEASWTPSQQGVMVKRNEEGAIVPHERDSVMERYRLLQRRSGGSQVDGDSLLKRGNGGEGVKAIRSLERQHLRKRIKRQLILPETTTTHSLRRSRRAPPPRIIADTPSTSPAPTSLDVFRKLFNLQDPLFSKQWHLANDVIEGNSINVTGVWAEGVFGKGVNVAIVDDGLDMHSDDLKDNFHAEGSWDYNDHTALPVPVLSDDLHGTRCAGEIAAGKNNVCGVGVAWEAGIAGIRILSASISDADEAAALNYGYQSNHIYSCSWGPPDDGRSMEAPGRLIVKAMLNGIQNGRGGKGSIFVFASGNGGALDDQCNFDGYTNSLMSITVGAIDRKEQHPFYSEACSANMVVTYSSGAGDNIHTTDVGKNVCTDRHGGTSAAAPIAAGIFALVLQVRPDLTWRDLQHLCVQTAVQVNADDPDWKMTASGRYYNHKYGFGKLDAWAIVNAARTFKLVKPQAWWESPVTESGLKITSNGTDAQITITKADLTHGNLEALEHVTARVNIDHERRGNLEIELISPHGTTSVLARTRRFDDAKTGFPDWLFMTVKHWEEDPIGTWTLRVRDSQTNGKTGTFLNWSIQLWGSAIDASIAKPWEMEEDEVISPPDEIPVSASSIVSTTATVATTSTVVTPMITRPVAALPTKSLIKPTAHLPDDHAEATGARVDDVIPTTTAVASRPRPSHGADRVPSDAAEDSSGYLKSIVGNRTWLFVAGGTIIIFIGAVSFWLRKRRRASNIRSGGGYDFAPSNDDEMGMSALERGRVRLGGGRARTMDLYDAFALGDEDESDDGDDQEEKDTRAEGKGVAESSNLLATDTSKPLRTQDNTPFSD